MRLIKKYIGSSILMSTFTVLFMIIGLLTFILFVGELRDIGVGNYGLWQAIQYTLLTIPTNLYDVFPMIGLLGSIIGLGYLASNRELLVMRVSGVSMAQIIWSVLRAAILILFVVTVLGEVVGPAASNLAQVKKAIDKSGGQALNTTHGLWLRDKNTFIRIQNVMPGLHFEGINQYQFSPNHRLLLASSAKSAVLQNNQWVLNGVVETHFDDGQITTRHVDHQIWNVNLNPNLINISKLNLEAISIPKLKEVITYRKQNGLSVRRYQLSFWQRVIQPFSTLIMILLAIPFVFGPLRSVPIGARIVFGIVAGFSFYLLNEFFGPFSLVYQIPPFLGAVLPTALFFMVGLIFIRRAR